MVFVARRSYASAVLGVVILSVCPSVCLSVCYTRALWLIQRTYRRYFYTTWKGNPSSQMWFFLQLCSSWQDFNWFKASCGPSAIAELLVQTVVQKRLEWLSVLLLLGEMECQPLPTKKCERALKRLYTKICYKAAHHVNVPWPSCIINTVFVTGVKM